MLIKVNVDMVGSTMGEHIESRLSAAGHPHCLGSMIPPVISRQVPFNDLEILIAKEAVSEKEVMKSDLSKIIDASVDHYQGKVMTQKHLDHIEDYKNDRAAKYVEHVIRCCNCNYTDVCNKLTENYLKVLAIQESIKLQDVLKAQKDI